MRLALLFVALFSFATSNAQVWPNEFQTSKTFGWGQTGEYIEFGYIENSGLGTYAKIRVNAHGCQELFINEYEFYGGYYSGDNTDWVEVPMRNGNDFIGSQSMALDVWSSRGLLKGTPA